MEGFRNDAAIPNNVVDVLQKLGKVILDHDANRKSASTSCSQTQTEPPQAQENDVNGCIRQVRFFNLVPFYREYPISQFQPTLSYIDDI